MGVMTDLTATRLYERIANMMLLQVAHEQIASTMGVDLEIIEQIKNRPDFNEVFERINEQYQAQLEIDINWDTIESRALETLKANLVWNKDPEFALKTAGIANKAVRRNRTNGNQPLPAQVGARININLSGGFVEQMKTLNGEATEVNTEKIDDKSESSSLLQLVKKSKNESDEPDERKKFDDLVSPAALKNMFALESEDADVQIDHFFGAKLDLILADD